MGGYLVNFSVYTFAMIGFLFLAVMVYKKSSADLLNKKNESGMAIEESLTLSPRKRLHVVRVNGERFLIAADVDRTEFLAKLDEKEPVLQDNVIKFNKRPNLISGQESKTDFKNVQNPISHVSTLKQETEKFGKSKLSNIKSINIKQPMFKEIMRKLEAAQG